MAKKERRQAINATIDLLRYLEGEYCKAVRAYNRDNPGNELDALMPNARSVKEWVSERLQFANIYEQIAPEYKKLREQQPPQANSL